MTVNGLRPLMLNAGNTYVHMGGNDVILLVISLNVEYKMISRWLKAIFFQCAKGFLLIFPMTLKIITSLFELMNLN